MSKLAKQLLLSGSKLGRRLLTGAFRGADVWRGKKLVMKNGKVLDDNWWVDKLNAHRKWQNKHRNFDRWGSK